MIFPIEIRDYYFKYFGNKKNILDGINLQVPKEQILAVVGMSGCGKSTLCYSMSGTIPHSYKGDCKGEVLLFGKDIKNMRRIDIARKVGIVFQDPDTQLFSPTVEDEIAFAPENLCLDREEIGRSIKDALEQVGMEKYRYKNPNHLSGGQKQLIAIASVLSLKPEILIFDEIMSQVDKQGKNRIKEVIKELKKSGKTIVMVEHDYNNLDMTDRVIVLKNGKIEEEKQRGNSQNDIYIFKEGE